MALFVNLTLFLLTLTGLLVADSPYPKVQIMFLINKGLYEEAIRTYRQTHKTYLQHDFELLEQMSQLILQQGILSRDPETQLLSVFGASVALNEQTEKLIESAYFSPYTSPEVQVAVLNYMSRVKSEKSLLILNQAIGHSHPLIRLEAAFHLAERKAPQASSKIESLMYKMPYEIHFVFPQLFAMLGDEDAIKNLRKLLIHQREDVRTQAILAVGEAKRDDLTKEIKRICLQHDLKQKEAAAAALGHLKDEQSIRELDKLTNHSNANLRVAALVALLEMRKYAYLPGLLQLAHQGNLFAIWALKDYQGSEDLLAEKIKAPHASVRVNAVYALLQKRDPRVFPALREILLRSARDTCYVPIHSEAGALTAIKAVPSSQQNLKETPVAFEISLELREEMLTQALELPEEVFLKVARMIFTSGQNELVPLLVSLLENKRTEHSIELLKTEALRAGAPFIRHYAALALFKMKEEGKWSETLKKWLLNESQVEKIDLISFRPLVPWELRIDPSKYELTPQEKSSLFINTLQAFLENDPDEAIQILLQLLESSPPKNRYVLAGLLLRATQ